MLMDEKEYLALADKALRRLVDAFDQVDPDEADIEFSGDVATISLPGGKKCIINTQRPARQIWLAGGQRAWHFSYDSASSCWLDDKTGQELFATLQSVVQDGSGVKLTFES